MLPQILILYQQKEESQSTEFSVTSGSELRHPYSPYLFYHINLTINTNFFQTLTFCAGNPDFIQTKKRAYFTQQLYLTKVPLTSNVSLPLNKEHQPTETSITMATELQPYTFLDFIVSLF